MAEQSALIRLPVCRAPEINRLLTAYCFGRAKQEEERIVEAHLPECDICRQDAERLEAAVRVLQTDRDLVRKLSAGEVSGAFGLSSRLLLPFAGHLWFALGISTLYALMCAVAMVLEVAYQFDRYGRMALLVATLIFCWTGGTSLFGLWLGWKWTLTERSGGLALTITLFIVAAVILYGGACLFLPPVPIVESRIQAFTATGAYLKALVTIIPLVLLFILTPYHFVITSQRDLRAGQNDSLLALLTGEKMSVAPRGTIYIRVWILAVLLVVAGVGLIPGAGNIFDNLKPSVWMNLFMILYYVRWGFYFALGLVCIFWYQRALNELKRECLIVKRMNTDGA